MGIRKIKEWKFYREDGEVGLCGFWHFAKALDGGWACNHLPSRCVLTRNERWEPGRHWMWWLVRGVVTLQLPAAVWPWPLWAGTVLWGSSHHSPGFAIWAYQVVISVSSFANWGHTRPTSSLLRSEMAYHTCLSPEHMPRKLSVTVEIIGIILSLCPLALISPVSTSSPFILGMPSSRLMIILMAHLMLVPFSYHVI